MRALKVTDFANAHEYEQAKKALRKGDRSRRQSPEGRKTLDWQNI